MQEEEEESKEPIEQEEEMSFFQWNVNEAMAKKALIPSLTVLISVENDRSEMDFFWRNSAVLHAMNSSFIVVRLGKNENALEISQFSQIFVIKSYPSLYVFGPFSHGISYAWTDGFPSVEEFNRQFADYVLNKEQTRISCNSIDIDYAYRANLYLSIENEYYFYIPKSILKIFKVRSFILSPALVISYVIEHVCFLLKKLFAR